MCATGTGTSVPSTVTMSASIQPPNVRWSTKLSAVPSSSSAAMRRWLSFGSGPSSICPLIPRWTTSAESPSSSVSHRYLPRRPVPVIASVQQPRRQVGGAGLVTSHGAGMVHPHGGDGLARHMCL